MNVRTSRVPFVELVASLKGQSGTQGANTVHQVNGQTKFRASVPVQGWSAVKERSSLSISVRDQQGYVIAGANITVTNDTGEQQECETSNDGSCSIQLLLADPIRIVATDEAFLIDCTSFRENGQPDTKRRKLESIASGRS